MIIAPRSLVLPTTASNVVNPLPALTVNPRLVAFKLSTVPSKNIAPPLDVNVLVPPSISTVSLYVWVPFEVMFAFILVEPPASVVKVFIAVPPPITASIDVTPALPFKAYV